MSFFDEISARLAGLGSASAAQIRAGLQEFDVRDIEAVRIAEGGGNGGSQSVKHVVVPVDYTDLDAATGLADLYLLPEGETILMSWPVVTVGFDGTESFGAIFQSAGAFGPSGAAGSSQISDSFNLTQPNASADGLIGPDPADSGGGSTTTTMSPIATPVPGGGPVQTVIDVGAGNVPLTTIGTQGHLDYHLVIAVAP